MTTSVILSFSLCLPVLAQAQVPPLLNYQGRIVVNGTNVDGVGYFKFALVDGGTNSSQPATAAAKVTNGFITAINVTSGGSGYSTPPAVTITDSTGSGAGAIAVLSGQTVGSITVTNAGHNYSASPTVTIALPPSNMVFQIFWANADHGSDGKSFASVALALNKGLYAVLLGDTNIPNMSPIPAAVFTNGDVRLRVWFSQSDSFPQFEQLGPDQRVAAVGYAMNAATAGFAATAAVSLAVSPAADVQGQRLNIGTNNSLTGTGATIAGGQGNTNVGWWATVGGGATNTAQGQFATVAGGEGNVAGRSPSISQGTYATVAGGQSNAATGLAAFIGGGAFNQASGDYAAIGGGFFNKATNDSATVGGGTGNTAAATYATVGGGNGNRASDFAALVSGGNENTASGYDATVGGGENNISSQCATVAGGLGNTATGAGSVIGGGGYDGSIRAGNTASGSVATIAGGYGNTATNRGASIGGGEMNTASGADSVVAGGHYNTASGPGASVGGGGDDGNLHWGNNASGPVATVGGGMQNAASGYASTVAGGGYNTASGAYSFAAGQWASAVHDGSFVWGDTHHGWDNPFQSTSSNQFLIYATGGVGIDTAYLPEGGLVVATNTFINGFDLFLRNDHNHGLGWYGTSKPFGSSFQPDGPVLYGNAGGGLGTVSPTLQVALSWDQNGVYARQPLTANGPATFQQGLTVNGAGTFNGSLVLNTNVHLNDHDLFLRADTNHGLGWYGLNKNFGTNAVNDGPVLYGNSSGALGVVAGNSPYLALEWDSSRVRVHPDLDVDGFINVHGELHSTGAIVGNYVYANAELDVNGDLTLSNGIAEIYGDLTVHGLKWFVVPHPTDTNKEIAYVATEGPEPVTFVRGSTNLVNGEAIISLPETYAMVTADEGLTVQLTPRGAWLQLYVADVNPRQLTVREAQGKSGRFDYLVQGVRKGYEDYQPIRPRRQTVAALARPQPLSNTKGQGQP